MQIIGAPMNGIMKPTRTKGVCPYCRLERDEPPATVAVGAVVGSQTPENPQEVFWDRPTQVLPDQAIRMRCPICGRALAVVEEAVWQAPGADLGEASRGAPAASAPAAPGALTTIDSESGIPSASAGHRRSGGGGGGAAAAAMQIPGYVIEGVIGTGGMGTVYLARQLSLDRHVALKVMSRRWVHDPVFLARFTREAYAAAQLSHPNIVQIYDIGEAEGLPFFSMEYVRGSSLSELVRRQGRLDPSTAVSYILQAARGLHYAHSRGLIHRDVKPDNLLLDEHGLIKVADLGLVKTPQGELSPRTPHPRQPDCDGWSASVEVTGIQIALGTPAYMSPEQCRDAASVDHRSDIYSLGCTLYVLLTGRPPYEGKSAAELMNKHVYEPVPAAEHWVPRLPRELSAIVQRMMAKSPAERYQSMEEVIQVLERWLGLPPQGTFVPKPEQAEQVEAWARQFRRAPAARRRRRVLTGAVSAWAVAELLLLFFAQPVWAIGWGSLLVHTTLGYLVFHGLSTHGPLFGRLRRCLLQASSGDYLLAGVGLILFTVLLTILGIVWIWWGFALIGLGLGGVAHYLLDQSVQQQQRRPIEACARLLRRLRNQGIAEDQLRLFIARAAGRGWEAFFEALFGYEAKLETRARLGASAALGYRERYAAWREPLIAWLDRWDARRQLLHKRRWLTRVEQARLVAGGEPAALAAVKAQETADELIQQAEKMSATDQPGRSYTQLGHLLSSHSLLGSSLFLGAGAAEAGPLAARTSSRLDRLLQLLLGTGMRCLFAAVLLAAFTLWLYQNIVHRRPHWATADALPAAPQPWRQLEQLGKLLMQPTEPLRLPYVPASYTAWINSWNIGVAALLLLVSLFYRGTAMGLFVLLGAWITACGAVSGIRTAEPLRPEHTALILGTTLTLIGLRCARWPAA
jgi:hypothetical protein